MSVERNGNRISIKRSPGLKKVEDMRSARGKAKDTRTDREILLNIESLMLDIREHQLKGV